MIFSVFEPLKSGEDYLISKTVATFSEVEKYDYRKYWADIGQFTLVVPKTANGIGAVRKDMLILVDEGGESVNDCLIVNDIQEDDFRITLSGTDLKGMLSYRVTMFPQKEIDAGTYGYDVRQGSTGAIIAGFIDYNCINASDPRRNIPGLSIGNTYGGLMSDTYMSRLQPLNEVVTAMCKNADIGWDIIFSPSYIAGYQFNIIDGNDKTNTTGMHKCVFADFLNNAESITTEDKSGERRNVIWTVNGSDTDKAVVTSIYKSKDSDMTSGFNRRETVLTANCDIDLTESYVDTKTADMIDKFQIDFTLVDPTMYGKRFSIGDKVTVIKNGVSYDRRVIEVGKSYSSGKRTISVKLGDIPAKKFFGKTSDSLSSRADDVKELALENASTKKKSAEIFGNTIYSFADPFDLNIMATPGMYWARLEGHRYVAEILQLVPARNTEKEETEEETVSQSETALFTALTIDGKTVSSIKVHKSPDKTVYYKGEKLDLSGGVLLITYDDGNITTVEMTDSSVSASGFDSDKQGKQEITLGYSGKTTKLTLFVNTYEWETVARFFTPNGHDEHHYHKKRISNGCYYE